MKKILSTTTNNVGILLNDFNVITEFENDVELVIFNEQTNDKILNLSKAKGIKTCGGERLDKLFQFILLSRLNINTPKVFYNIHQNRTIQTIDELNAFVDIDEFVVKPPSGSRGIGVKKITRDEWKKCYFDKKEVYNVFKNEFVPIKGGDIEKIPNIKESLNDIEYKDKSIYKEYIEDHFCHFIIQEPIDVDREFRLLYFNNGEYLCYERVKKEGEFCGNLSHGSTPKQIEPNSDDDIQIIQPIIKDIDCLIGELNYPWLSVDLYMDKFGKMGVFEFQMEFAYEGFDYKDVRKKMVDCVNFLIKKVK